MTGRPVIAFERNTHAQDPHRFDGRCGLLEVGRQRGFERVGELQAELTGVKTASSQFRAIQQRVETEWQIHQSLRERIGQTSLESEKSSNVTHLMSAPIVAHKPSKPGKAIATVNRKNVGQPAYSTIGGVNGPAR